MLKTQARHVFFFVKSIQTHIRPKKLSAALFLQQRAFLCFMLLSCLSLVDRCDIDQGQLLHICIFQTGYECGCGIQRGQYVDTCLDRVPADDESVFGVLNTLGRSIDDEVDLVAEDQVHQVRGRLLDLVGADRIDAVLVQGFRGISRRIDLVAESLESLCDRNDILFILILYGDDHVFVFRQVDSGAEECFVKSLVEGLCNTKALTGGFHLRSKGDICAADLLEGEYRHLDGNVICLSLQTRLVAKLADRVAEDDFRCQRHDRDSGYLADVRHGTRRTRVDLDDVNILTAYDELDVDHTDDMQGSCQTFRILYDGVFCMLADALCRINGDTVSGVNAGALDVLHDTRNQNIGAVADCINLDFLALQIFINQDRMLLVDKYLQGKEIEVDADIYQPGSDAPVRSG